METIYLIGATLLLFGSACSGAGERATGGQTADGRSAGLGVPAASAPRGLTVATDGSAEGKGYSEAEATVGPALPGAGAADTAAIPAMIIRNGQAVIEVDSLEPAIAALQRLAKQAGGYVANTSIQGGKEQRRSATLELKIPASRFDQAVQGLQPIGEVTSVNIASQDVGEEFVDVSARLLNSRRLEGRLLDILGTRTGKLQDVLAVERELARVREEIERMTGRLRYLRSQVALGTLSVTVEEPAPLIGSLAGRNPIVEAMKDGWRNFVRVIAAGIALLGGLLPILAVAAGAWWGIRRWQRTR